MSSTDINFTKTLWAVHIGPYHSPYEKYPYFSLPFCHFEPDDAITRVRRMEDRRDSNWVPFAELNVAAAVSTENSHNNNRTRVTQEFHCRTDALTESQARNLETAVRQGWFFQLSLDDLPIWGNVGEDHPSDYEVVVEGSARVYTEIELMVRLNPKGDLVRVDVFSNTHSLVSIQAGKALDFSMKAIYNISASNVGNRYDHYVDHVFFNSPVRTMSAWNSSILALMILAAMASFIWRIWKHNNNRTGDSNNKSLSALEKGNATSTQPLLSPPEQQQTKKPMVLDPKEMFAPPRNFGLLAVFVGNGWHLYVFMCVMAMWFKDTNPYEFGPGGRWEALVVGYSATSIVGGYMSSSFYFRQQATKEEGGESWGRVMIWTSLLMPLSTMAINRVVWLVYLAGRTVIPPQVEMEMNDLVSFATFRRFLLWWICLAVPSQVLGTFLGRWHELTCANPIDSFVAFSLPDMNHPTTKNRLSKIKLEWLLNIKATQSAVILLSALSGGVICFSVIFVDFYFALTSLWSYKNYLVTWTNIVVLVLLFLVSSGTGVFITLGWLKLVDSDNAKKSFWQWSAFLSCASTGVYCFAYSIHYVAFKFHLAGLYAILHYFGTMLVLSMMMALICGALAHFAAYQCVRLLYSSNIKAA